MKTLSLVMIARNEAETLARCLDSVYSLVDEIILVDTGSTDNTKEIARSYHAKVFDYTWNQHFAEARNYALEQSTSDWNLILDADEYISNECGETIRQFINGGNAIGRIKRIDKFMDKNGEAYAQCYISRIFPKGIVYEGRIHEQVQSNLSRKKLSVEVQHDGYYMKVKSDRNIPLLKLELEADPSDPYYHYQIAKEYKAIENHNLAYVHLQKAYQLITRKEIYAPNVIVNFLYAIIAVGKLEEGLGLIEREREFLHDFADFHFASGVYYLDLILGNTEKYIGLLPLIEQAYLQCLEIGETDRYDSVIGTGSYASLHNLGVFYEVTGNETKSRICYQKAAALNYQPSIQRL
ncbi:glycosyltransferase involved in cell wall biosynthesis [Paenibacillus forsythiae]|uniref:Glycosyltransferase involved in cell wall biosynthesis n=1 Tax=Paenibacillus forsythiae TaxID=365616 RepID=A0ABU3HB80_9BACL|nr:glycosyltransferase family 2 protein [Paenibacillus forsythiae]MDT3427985.1 glycosyltransferase involved in cell wall biosynthesis [Paenibacillus forsythiae]